MQKILVIISFFSILSTSVMANELNSLTARDTAMLWAFSARALPRALVADFEKTDVISACRSVEQALFVISLKHKDIGLLSPPDLVATGTLDSMQEDLTTLQTFCLAHPQISSLDLDSSKALARVKEKMLF